MKVKELSCLISKYFHSPIIKRAGLCEAVCGLARKQAGQMSKEKKITYLLHCPLLLNGPTQIYTSYFAGIDMNCQKRHIVSPGQGRMVTARVGPKGGV